MSEASNTLHSITVQYLDHSTYNIKVRVDNRDVWLVRNVVTVKRKPGGVHENIFGDIKPGEEILIEVPAWHLEYLNLDHLIEEENA